MKKYIKPCVVFFLAIIGVIGLNFNIVNGVPFIRMFVGKTQIPTIYGNDPGLNPNYSGLTTAGIFEFIALLYIIKRNIKIENKRLQKFSLGLAIVLSLLYILGNAVIIHTTIKIIGDYFFLYVIKLSGITVVLYNIILIVFNRMINFEQEEIEEKEFFTGNVKSFLIVLLVLLLAWLPYFLNSFPGFLTTDAIVQVNQVLGNTPMNLNNPFIHTMFVGFAIQIGNNIFGSISAGVAIYVVLQTLIMGVICSFTIYYLARKKVNVKLRAIVLLFYTFFPIIPIFNIMMIKDTLFAGLMLMYTIVFFELLTNYKSLFNSNIRIIASVLIIILAALARRNSFYAVIVTAPILAIYVLVKRTVYNGYRAKIIALFGIACTFIIIINGCINNAFKAPNSWKQYVPAKYSFCLQQLLKTTIDNYEDMSEEDLSIMAKLYFDGEKEADKEVLTKVYTPYLADSAMSEADSVYFKEHKDEIMSLYVRLMFKYPISYIDAIFCATSGYWDIEESRISVWPSCAENDFGVVTTPIYKSYIVNMIEGIATYPHNVFIGLMYNSGLAMWLLISVIFFNLYNKKYNLVMLTVPLLLYFATVLLGPLNGEVRYIYYLYMCLPLLVVLTLKNK